MAVSFKIPAEVDLLNKNELADNPLLPVGQGELALGSVVLLGSTTSLVILGQSAHVDRVSAEASRLAVGPAWFWLPYWHGLAVPSPA